eukprot:TRINITY_DN10353_c0_g1_i1.p1 TRINITY_DN10353_c0_g1~~TRINITY_DN10353_c0_g1_i1.p1  ORF type:complete len:130 (-),score=9.17 TRINITY_DN10353_c0_g1_i1:106-495(-)
MEKVKSSYEGIVVFSLKDGNEKIAELIKKFKELIEKNATLNSLDEWGKRRLAYLIEKQAEGYYVLFDFTSVASFPAEFERILKITDGILRFLIIKKEPEKRSSKKQAKKDEHSKTLNAKDESKGENEDA